jgi:hypothetical protein
MAVSCIPFTSIRLLEPAVRHSMVTDDHRISPFMCPRELSEVEIRELALDLRPYMERTPFVVRLAALSCTAGPAALPTHLLPFVVQSKPGVRC